METKDEIKVGDVVIHCISGRVMKVIEIKGDSVRCQWEENGIIRGLFYKLSGLRKFIKTNKS